VNFSISRPGIYNLSVSDILGTPIILQNTIHFNQGDHEIQIDTNDLPSGMYLVQIGNENVSMVGELILNK
jgi:hypothetical protein